MERFVYWEVSEIATKMRDSEKRTTKVMRTVVACGHSDFILVALCWNKEASDQSEILSVRPWSQGIGITIFESRQSLCVGSPRPDNLPEHHLALWENVHPPWGKGFSLTSPLEGGTKPFPDFEDRPLIMSICTFSRCTYSKGFIPTQLLNPKD